MILPLVTIQAGVTFAASADVASRLLPKLGAAIGLPLTTDSRAGTQVMLVRVHTMPRERLLRLIAGTTGGSWRPFHEGYRLTLGKEEAQALWKEETRSRTSGVRNALAVLAKRGADDACLAQALTALGPETLASVRPGERLAWSAGPGSFGRPLPEAAFEAGRQLVRSARRTLAAARSSGTSVDAEAEERTGHPVATVVLSLQRDPESADLGASLLAFDEEGRTLAGALGRAAFPAPAALEVPDAPFAAPPDADALTGASKGVLPPLALAMRLLRPDLNEPLALAVGPAIEAVAEGGNAVAVLPDAAYEPLAKGLGDAKRVPEVAETLARAGVELRREGDAVTGRPAWPAAALERRADRAALRRLLASAAVNGGFTLDDLPEPGLLFPLYRSIEANPKRFYEFDVLSQTPLKRAWTSLSSAQREAALSALGLRLRSEENVFYAAGQESLLAFFVDEEPQGVPSRSLASWRALFTGSAPSIIVRARMTLVAMTLTQPAGHATAGARDFYETARLIATAARPEYQSPTTRFWPGDAEDLSLLFEGSAPTTDYTASATMAGVVRQAGAATRFPDLYPALRAEVRRARG